MNLLEGLEYNNICMQCNQKVINYPNQLCRRQFLSSSQINEYSEIRSVQFNDKTSGNFKLDEFINETQLNSKYCDDFIEWIPHSNLENVKYLTNGGNSKVYFGTWNLMLNMSLASIVSNQLSFKVALKAINDSDNINDHILNELKIHHQCRNPRVVPFYGITKAPKGNEYAMVIRHAKHGDLRNYICDFFPKLTWTDRVKILIELSKALNSIHQMNLLHKDFHCKNILVDEGDRIFISDFGLCQPIGSEIDVNHIQNNHSLSMIMWELISDEPPFSNRQHDAGLALAVLDGLRPEDIKGTPDFYSNLMKQCWNFEPLKRPDASHLPKLFEEMMELCKMIDDDTISSKIAFCLSESTSTQPNYVTDSNENSIQPEYETKAYEYTLKKYEDEDNNQQVSPIQVVPYKDVNVNNDIFNEEEDSRYITQTYKFSLNGKVICKLMA
ncbi:kinase-like protein [Rhizophagus irregularis]|uniref:Kinase-like protein n=1 Tax=Rhizophagus irregularis TaxID=588596 RepID=A0A2N1MSG6_9GLOM|nr:kinase-like protein [Rhizophagus irregularis]